MEIEILKAAIQLGVAGIALGLLWLVVKAMIKAFQQMNEGLVAQIKTMNVNQAAVAEKMETHTDHLSQLTTDIRLLTTEIHGLKGIK